MKGANEMQKVHLEVKNYSKIHNSQENYNNILFPLLQPLHVVCHKIFNHYMLCLKCVKMRVLNRLNKTKHKQKKLRLQKNLEL